MRSTRKAHACDGGDTWTDKTGFAASSRVHFWRARRPDHRHTRPPQNTFIMADLAKHDVERAEFAFGIYDSDGTGIDAVDLGDLLRALNLNPTLAVIEKLGGTKKKNEKKLKFDEFLPIFSQCKKEKDAGCFEDFNECLKLYDKDENGKMLLAELSHTLLSLGERLENDQVDTILKECCGPEDDDGFIDYVPFLKRVVEGPLETSGEAAAAAAVPAA